MQFLGRPCINQNAIAEHKYMWPFNSISSTRALCLLAGSVGHVTEHGQLGELMSPQ